MGLYKIKPDGTPKRIRTDPETWMQHRMELFFQYTLPSMINQTCQNFVWFVLVDQVTPQAWKQLLASIRYPNLHLIYVDTSRERFRDRTITAMEKGDYVYLTTRIDNDDAFHSEAVYKLQQCYLENIDRPQPWAAIFSIGCVYDAQAKKLYLTKHTSNNCPTLVESGYPPQTVWIHNHGDIPRKFPVIYIEEIPYWLMVCHDQNLANHPRPSSVNRVFDKNPLPLHLLGSFGVLQHAQKN